MMEEPAHDLEAIYTKTIAGKFVLEKRMIVKELMQHGILSILTTPQMLTVNAVNKYLELKEQASQFEVQSSGDFVNLIPIFLYRFVTCIISLCVHLLLKHCSTTLIRYLHFSNKIF